MGVGVIDRRLRGADTSVSMFPLNKAYTGSFTELYSRAKGTRSAFTASRLRLYQANCQAFGEAIRFQNNPNTCGEGSQSVGPKEELPRSWYFLKIARKTHNSPRGVRSSFLGMFLEGELLKVVVVGRLLRFGSPSGNRVCAVAIVRTLPSGGGSLPVRTHLAHVITTCARGVEQVFEQVATTPVRRKGDEEEEDDDFRLKRQPEVIIQPSASSSTAADMAEVDDPRLRRLLKARTAEDESSDEELDRVARHQRVLDPEVQEEAEGDDEPERLAREEESSGEEDLDEEEIERRRMLMRLRARERAQAEEERCVPLEQAPSDVPVPCGPAGVREPTTERVGEDGHGNRAGRSRAGRSRDFI
ncbi:hypothetical protein Bbelb_351520 [Branchiostoma belcheri]|nr:hypothetical protein Bbelb_351520 [Branchiostoma belcheri]